MLPFVPFLGSAAAKSAAAADPEGADILRIVEGGEEMREMRSGEKKGEERERESELCSADTRVDL